MIKTSKYAFMVTSIMALFAGSGCSSNLNKPTTQDSKTRKPSTEHKTNKAAHLYKASYTNTDTSQAKASLDEDFDTWERVFRGFQLNGSYNRYPQVQEFVRFYGQNPAQLTMLSERASIFLHMIVSELDRRGMPTELALLPFVESAFDPDIFSRAGAAGLWQFIPSTGRDYGLTQSRLYDARMDPFAATGAALNYLQKLHAQFNGDWLLALAAYNCGEGRVEKEIAKNQAAGIPVSFWTLSLPRETREYVPRLLAFKELIRNASYYGIQLPETPNQARLAQLRIDKAVDLREVAMRAGLDANHLLELNPCFRTGVTTPQYSNRIILPREHAPMLAQIIEAVTPADLPTVPKAKKPRLIYAKASKPKQYNKLATARLGKRSKPTQYALAKSKKNRLRTAERNETKTRA